MKYITTFNDASNGTMSKKNIGPVFALNDKDIYVYFSGCIIMLLGY